MPRVSTLVSLVVMLTACAANVPSGNADIGRLTPRAEQLPVSSELHNTCAGLTITARSRIDQLRELQKKAKEEAKGPAPTLMSWFGETPAAADAAKELKHVEELNAALKSKSCATLDIEEELRKLPSKPIPATTPKVK